MYDNPLTNESPIDTSIGFTIVTANRKYHLFALSENIKMGFIYAFSALKTIPERPDFLVYHKWFTKHPHSGLEYEEFSGGNNKKNQGCPINNEGNAIEEDIKHTKGQNIGKVKECIESVKEYDIPESKKKAEKMKKSVKVEETEKNDTVNTKEKEEIIKEQIKERVKEAIKNDEKEKVKGRTEIRKVETTEDSKERGKGSIEVRSIERISKNKLDLEERKVSIKKDSEVKSKIILIPPPSNKGSKELTKHKNHMLNRTKTQIKPNNINEYIIITPRDTLELPKVNESLILPTTTPIILKANISKVQVNKSLMLTNPFACTDNVIPKFVKETLIYNVSEDNDEVFKAYLEANAIANSKERVKERMRMKSVTEGRIREIVDEFEYEW